MARKKSRVRRFLQALACFALLVIAACGALIYHVQTGVLISPEALPPPASPTPVQAAHAQQAVQRLQAVLAAPVNRRSHKKVVMEQADVNTLIATRAPVQVNERVKRLHVDFSQGAVSISGYVPWQGQYAPVHILGLPVSQNGSIGFNVQSIMVGDLPAPPPLRNRIQAEITRYLRQNQSRIRGVIGVAVGPGILTLDMSEGKPNRTPH